MVTWAGGGRRVARLVTRPDAGGRPDARDGRGEREVALLDRHRKRWMLTAGRDGRGERGVALLVTLLAATVLVALAGALAPLALIETAVVANQRRALQGLHAADAALALTSAEVASLDDWSAVRTGAWRAAVRVGPLTPARPDGTIIDLPTRTTRLRDEGAGASAAGRGLDWTLAAYGPLAAWVDAPAGYGPWILAVWIADLPLGPAGAPCPESQAAGDPTAGGPAPDPPAPPTPPAEADPDPDLAAAAACPDALAAHAAAFGPGRTERAVQAVFFRLPDGPPPRPVRRAAWRIVR